MGSRRGKGHVTIGPSKNPSEEKKKHSGGGIGKRRRRHMFGQRLNGSSKRKEKRGKKIKEIKRSLSQAVN